MLCFFSMSLICLSRSVFAIMDAALTAIWFRSALNSAVIFVFAVIFAVSSCVNVLLFDGRSIIVFFASGVVFIIFAMAFISMWFRDMFFMSLSICFAGMIIILTFFAIFLISFSRVSRFFVLRSFESVMPRSFRCCSCSFFMWTPAITNGPITGPRPASSIPSVSIGSFLGRVRYINVCSVRDYISFF